MKIMSYMLVSVFTLALAAVIVSNNTGVAKSLESLIGGLASWIRAASTVSTTGGKR